MIKCIDHVGITVSDLDRSLAFYVGTLGLRLIDRETIADETIAELTGYDAVEMDCADLDSGDGRILELIQYRTPAGGSAAHELRDGGTVHVSLRVDDLDAVLAAIEGSGARIVSRRPVLFEEPGSPWDGVRCVYVADPDGVVLELVQRPETEASTVQGAAESPPSTA
jgi:catechol 2,3-dioxygenase-like lactoylglutathione lyase family enzyme